MSTLVKVLIALFLPPISVLMTTGFGLHFLLNCLLCLLFYFPGCIHAFWLMQRDSPAF